MAKVSGPLSYEGGGAKQEMGLFSYSYKKQGSAGN